jgi:hypothetical protein
MRCAVQRMGKRCHLMPISNNDTSDLELLHLAFEPNTMEKEIVFVIYHFCFYVWDQKKKHGNRFIINVDKLRIYFMKEFLETQFGQNFLAFIPF